MRKLTGDCFFRPIGGEAPWNMRQYAMDAEESGFIQGALVGTMEMPKGFPGECMVWGFMDAWRSAAIDLNEMKVTTGHEDSDIGSLATNSMWQARDPGSFQVFLRECKMPCEKPGHQTMLMVSAGFFPKSLAGEHIHSFHEGKHVASLDVKEAMRGEALASVLKKPYWGKNQEWGFPGTMHLAFLEMLEKRDHLERLPSRTMEESLELEKTMSVLRAAYLVSDTKDPQFAEFRKQMNAAMPLMHSEPMNREEWEKRDALSEAINRKIMNSEYGSATP